jgi:phosphoglycolate phosphatase-like HAD superfamily hydrolase
MIFFDLDGPILDVSRKYYQVYKDIVLELGGNPLDFSTYWERKRKKLPDSETLDLSGLSQAKLEDFLVTRKHRIETPSYWQFDRVWKELLLFTTTSTLRGQVCLVTFRNDRVALMEELSSFGILDWFEEVITMPGDAASGDRSSVKADAVYQRYGEVERGVFIGDTETDIRAGKKLGLTTVAVTYGIRTSNYLQKEKPDFIFDLPSNFVLWLSKNAIKQFKK